MQLIIDIPEEVYKSIINGKNYISYQECVEESLREAVVLPKGHGRLIDANALEFQDVTVNMPVDLLNQSLEDVIDAS